MGRRCPPCDPGIQGPGHRVLGVARSLLTGERPQVHEAETRVRKGDKGGCMFVSAADNPTASSKEKIERGFASMQLR